MSNVRIEQRNAHLAGPVRLEYVNGREGKVAKGTVTVISNSRRGSGEDRKETATHILWTLWDKQAESAAEYLGKGSHVNVVGRMSNNDYEKDGATVYGMNFTCEELDYLDSKAESEARRARVGNGQPAAQAEPRPANGKAPRGRKARAGSGAGAATAAGADADDDVPF